MTTTDIGVLAVLVAIFLPHAIFALRYGPTRPWYRSWEGRALLASATAWALISGAFVVDFWFPVPDVLWIVFGLFAAVSGWIKLGLLDTSDRERKGLPPLRFRMRSRRRV